MNIFITGGLGFIGSNLAKHLSEHNKITILTNTLSKVNNIDGLDNIDILVKDINDITSDDLKDIDIVYHCASTVDNYNILTNPKLDFIVNCEGTITLLEAIRPHINKIKLIYTSSFFVNGNPNVLPATEESREYPLGLYGISKLAAEQILDTYGRVYGLNYCVARLTNVFGIGEQFNNNKKAAFNRILWDLTNGKDVNIYDGGKIIRDYIYIDNVITALSIIANNGISGELYFVGSGIGTKFGDMINHAISSVGETSGKMVVIYPPEFHKSVGIDDFYCDNSKLKSLGWTYDISVFDGIDKTIEYYKKQKDN